MVCIQNHKVKAKIWFNWADMMYCDGKPIRQCANTEVEKIGEKLGWHNDLTFQQLLVNLRDNYLNWYRLETISEINNGYCWDFANDIWNYFPHQCQMLDDGMFDYQYSHTFLKHNDLYYDAEEVEGVKNWLDLPLFHRRPPEKNT